jgi:hypothetical protein
MWFHFFDVKIDLLNSIAAIVANKEIEYLDKKKANPRFYVSNAD